MKLRAGILLLLAALTLGYRGVSVYMRYFSEDLRSHAPYTAELRDRHMTVVGVEPSAARTAAARGTPFVRQGDRILEIYDGKGRGGQVTGSFSYGALLRPINVEEPWTLVVERPGPGGAVEQLRLRMPPATPATKPLGDLLVGLGLEVYLPLVAMAAGLFIGLMKPRDDQAFLAAVVFLGLSASFGQSVAQFPAGWRELALGLQITASHFAPLLTLLFFLRFPARSALDRRLPWVAPAAGAVTVVVWGVAMALGFAQHLSFGTHARWLQALASWGLTRPRIEDGTTILVAGMLGLAIASLVSNAVAAETRDERRRMRLIAAGTITGLAPVLVSLGLESVGVKLPAWFLFLAIPLLGVFPLSFVYAVVRHRVFGIRVIVRRGLQYAVVSRGILVFEGLLIFGGLYFAAAPVFEALVSGRNPALASAGTALATLVLLKGVSGVNRQVLPAIDRRFFRDAYNGQRILIDLSRAVRQLASRPDQLLTKIGREIDAALHPRRIAILLDPTGTARSLRPVTGAAAIRWEGRVAGESVQRFALFLETSPVPDGGRPDHDTSTLAARLPLAEHLERCLAREPETLDVLPAVRPVVGIPPRERGACADDRALFDRFDARLVVPFVTAGRVVGFLLLGEKLSEEPYTGEDKELLMSVAEQAAVALDYAQLIGQAAEQASLRRELQIAEEVQAKLFPQELHEMRTLVYRGVCRAARGVGGDYYDFLPLASGQLGLAVADIAGKGLPAALLMASLQGLLRSHAPMAATNLGELGQELNRHLCETTDPERFATLFFGVYADDTRCLRFVNAGHLPPIVLRAGRAAGDAPSVLRLEPSGMVLGVLPGQCYGEQRVELAPGDRLLVFSDGITEAANAEEEMFGDERLLEVVRSGAALPVDELLQSVLDAVGRFVDGAPQRDDLTLIVAEVV